MPGHQRAGRLQDYAANPGRYRWGDIEKAKTGPTPLLPEADGADQDNGRRAPAHSSIAATLRESERGSRMSITAPPSPDPRPAGVHHVRPGDLPGQRAARDGQPHVAPRAEAVRRGSAPPHPVGSRDLSARRRSPVATSCPTPCARSTAHARREPRVPPRAFPEGGEVLSEVDGKPLTTPWLSLLAASDTSILPPQLAFALQSGEQRRGAATARCSRSSAPSARWASVSRAAGRAGVHGQRQARRSSRGRSSTTPLQRRHPPRSRRAQSLADGSDRIGQLHPVHRRHPADAVRPERHRRVRLGGHRHRAARHARRR